jgi:SAM-dependent methyltransferase
MNKLRLALNANVLRRRGKDAFVHSLAPKARLFDIGCGNESPSRVAALRPDVHYIGLDVGDYNLSAKSKGFASEYIVCPPEAFAESIRSYGGRVDAIISAHNLEHCDDPNDVLRAMASKLSSDGTIYIAYPCKESVGFPSRAGTLNFHDDPTHRTVIDTDAVVSTLETHGVTIDFVSRRYRPKMLATLGLGLEPLSWALRRNMPLAATWALYGFETVIWGRKK